MTGVLFACFTGRGQWNAAASFALGTVSAGPDGPFAPAGAVPSRAERAVHAATHAGSRNLRIAAQPTVGHDAAVGAEEPATVSVVFESLTAGADLDAGNAGAPSVSPALATILRALGDRAVRATFFVSPETAEREPFALTMLQNAGHELA